MVGDTGSGAATAVKASLLIWSCSPSGRYSASAMVDDASWEARHGGWRIVTWVVDLLQLRVSSTTIKQEARRLESRWHYEELEGRGGDGMGCWHWGSLNNNADGDADVPRKRTKPNERGVA